MPRKTIKCPDCGFGLSAIYTKSVKQGRTMGIPLRKYCETCDKVMIVRFKVEC